MNSNLFRRSLLALCLVFVLLQTAFGRTAIDPNHTQTPHAPHPFPPARYIPDHDFDTRHVALDLRFDWEHEQLIGIETMVLKPLISDLRTVEVDAANMTITSVKLSGVGPLKYESDIPNEKLRIALV